VEQATPIAAGSLEIRHVRTHHEFMQCVELQAATWGADFRESMPATILKITQRLGGVTAGAFAPDGALLGFVFGITGVEHGALVHWSDMLAVDARVQNAGIGRLLKEFQRDAARAVGATRMYWTFDPLVARNAHFNLNRLGARVAEYVQDMYGADTGCALHRGMGTDRFIVVWPIDRVAGDGTAGEQGASRAAWGETPVLNAATSDDQVRQLASLSSAPPPLARVLIPADIFRVQQNGTDDAIRWRQSTRHAFQWAQSNGYRIDGFARDPFETGGHYLLTHVHP
jgi:predicted GNAT superfamily acetyltransferase